MKKHWKKALFLFLALILLLSVPAAAKTVRKGWRTENGTTYYYKNGRAVKGIRTIGKKTYFFDKKGRLAKNRWVWSKGKKYRTNSKGQIRKNGFITVSGKKYLLNADGSVAKGFKSAVKTGIISRRTEAWRPGLPKLERTPTISIKKASVRPGKRRSAIPPTISRTTESWKRKNCEKREDDLLRKRRQEADRQRSGEEEDPGEGGKNRSEDHQCLHEQGAENADLL